MGHSNRMVKNIALAVLHGLHYEPAPTHASTQGDRLTYIYVYIYIACSKNISMQHL